MNPRDNDLNITDHGDHLVFDGAKNFNTGGVVSDLTVLEGVYVGTEHHIFAFIPTEQPGIQFAVSLYILNQWLLTQRLAAQLEQRRTTTHRIRKRENQPSQSSLGRCPRLGRINQTSRPQSPRHPICNSPSPNNPTRVLQFLSWNSTLR